ncbi:Hint domain-containing protein [Paracoccus sp. Ld10]|uniref:Hint domain-containing protein n=1 Tax=Paracoccus sp. Ld10 TaxID=649158 RepID=UPI00386F5F41
MPVTVAANSTIYAYNGSFANLLGLTTLPNLGTSTSGLITDSDGILGNSTGPSTISLSGGATQGLSYLGSGSYGTILDSNPVVAFSIAGDSQLYLYFPEGLPLLGGLAGVFNVTAGGTYALPASSVGVVDGTDAGQAMSVGFSDANGDRITTGADTVLGNGGNDTINAGAGNDLIDGGDGDDVLEGAAGNDTIYGGAGNDTLSGGSGVNVIYGGDGDDTWLGGASSGAGTDNVQLGAGNDTAEVGYFPPNTGADTLDGGAGNDTIAFDSVALNNLAVGIVLNDTGAATNIGFQSVITNFENVRGNAANNAITGNSQDNILWGQGGNDTLLGGAGNDTIEGGADADTLDGGAGTDTLTYANSTAGVNVNLATNTASGGDAQGDTISNFENLTGSAQNDTLTGNTGANTILGGAGNDTIDGGAGADSLDGGAGTDTLSYAGSTAGVNVNLATAAVSGGDAQGDTISNFENVTGSAQNDTLTGNTGANTILGGTGNDTIDGGAGADSLDGGAGTDTLTYANSTAGVNVNLATNTASGGDAQGDTISNFENLTGSAQNDTLTGNTGANTILGGAGNDFLDGGAGNDTLEGGAGNDTLTGGAGADRFVIDGASADVIVDFSPSNSDDGDASNNDFINLGDFYNAANLAEWNATPGNPQYQTPLQWLRADISDGVLDSAGGTVLTGVTGDQLNLENAGVVCFAAGTRIRTARGDIAVQDLRPGDLVMTKDRGLRPVQWAGGRKLADYELNLFQHLRPIRIKAGALGANIPAQDLVVSPQHRILVRSAISRRMFGADEVLVAAKQLLMLDGIDIADDLDQIEYVHFMFDRHEIVFANGAEAESLYTGVQALKAVSPKARIEIMTLFPNLFEKGREMPPVRQLLSGRMGRKLAMRHLQNDKALVRN